MEPAKRFASNSCVRGKMVCLSVPISGPKRKKLNNNQHECLHTTHTWQNMCVLYTHIFEPNRKFPKTIDLIPNTIDLISYMLEMVSTYFMYLVMVDEFAPNCSCSMRSCPAPPSKRIQNNKLFFAEWKWNIHSFRFIVPTSTLTNEMIK